MAKLLSGLCVLMASLARRMRVAALDLKCQSAFASIAAGYWPMMHAGYRTDWRSAFLAVAESASDEKGERCPLRAARSRK
ncbi:hypothetical protein [Bradyrhizobium ivorense]|uniref:hypothetical protein n=1 Tax=Bradyrhizobium ivorense TaxID=2511166 RepID=UPI001117AD3C|nr:hypothetical protein [Bradyrhizobium ivorense]